MQKLWKKWEKYGLLVNNSPHITICVRRYSDLSGQINPFCSSENKTFFIIFIIFLAIALYCSAGLGAVALHQRWFNVQEGRLQPPCSGHVLGISQGQPGAPRPARASGLTGFSAGDEAQVCYWQHSQALKGGTFPLLLLGISVQTSY